MCPDRVRPGDWPVAGFGSAAPAHRRWGKLRFVYLCGIFSIASRVTATGMRHRMSMRVESWVVYLKTLHGTLGTPHAVCEQTAWDEMERVAPGHHKLIQSGIATEGEAERLARAQAVPRQSVGSNGGDRRIRILT